MQFGITLAQLNPRVWDEAARAADRVGFHSLWMAEHLVLPVEMRGQLVPGEDHAPIAPDTPVFDAAVYLGHLAARTERIRLGTFVYLLGLRHPFVSARAFATLDVLSGGRVDLGVGAGWLLNEWEAVGIDPSVRGRRLDEAIAVCARLWSEDVISHDGEFWRFPDVMFEPKPVQKPYPPLHVGGESDRALRRAALVGDGWIGMFHTPESAAAAVGRLRKHEADVGRQRRPVHVTVVGAVGSRADIAAWEDAGVDQLIVIPWSRSSEAVGAIERFAAMAWG